MQPTASMSALAPDRHRGKSVDSHKAPQVERLVIPLAEEQVEIGTRAVERTVKIRKSVETRTEHVEQVLRDVTVTVDRVPVGREVAEAPSIREEGDVLIIPVLEEELVVRTRLVLKEELHVRRRREERTAQQDVPLRREVVHVEGPAFGATEIGATETGGHDGNER